MSARIETLAAAFARQAGIVWQEQPELGVWIAFDCELTEFAQLIVRECVTVAGQQANAAVYPEIYADLSRAIIKHFGVEE
jgi:hypothetical protein